MVRSDGVDDPVGAHLLRVVGEHRHAGLGARLDDHGWHVGEVAREHDAHLAQDRGHGAAQRDTRDGRRLGKEPTVGEHHLVGGRARVRLDSPGGDEGLAVEHPEDGVGVADVDREQH
jgi:hypothetical protein